MLWHLKKEFQEIIMAEPPGVPNKTTTDLRQWITNFVETNRNRSKKTGKP